MLLLVPSSDEECIELKKSVPDRTLPPVLGQHRFGSELAV